MKKRTSSLPLLVIVAVIALVIGSFGTADAAGLTKKKVKQIATKVVHKEAPTLSVAHAVTADTATNATLLNGQPATAYQNVSFKYRLPTQAASTDKVYNFPGLPTGTYLFTYSVIVNGGSGTTFCYIRPSAANTNGDGFTYMATNGGALSTVSSSGIVQGTGTAINMRCAGTSFSMYNLSDVSSSVTFTKLDTVTNSNGTAPRGSDGGSISGNLATAN